MIPQMLHYKLRIRQRRVLVPIGTVCPFGCYYCYAPEISAPNGIDADSIVDAVRALDQRRFDIIQLGYDGDPFAPLHALNAILPPLSRLDKHINLSTKARIPRSAINLLGHAHAATSRGLSVNVSLTCWESAPSIEPRTPPPSQRLAGANAMTAETGIPFIAALRPLLPNVSDDELCRVVDAVAASSALGVVTGPLYVAELDPDHTSSGGTQGLDPQFVPWSPVPMSRHRIDDRRRRRMIAARARERGLASFTKNAHALRVMEK